MREEDLPRNLEDGASAAPAKKRIRKPAAKAAKKPGEDAAKPARVRKPKSSPAEEPSLPASRPSRDKSPAEESPRLAADSPAAKDAGERQEHAPPPSRPPAAPAGDPAARDVSAEGDRPRRDRRRDDGSERSRRHPDNQRRPWRAEGAPPRRDPQAPGADSPSGEGGGQGYSQQEARHGDDQERRDRKNRFRKSRKDRRKEIRDRERDRENAMLETAPAVEVTGLTEISPKGFGFLRLPADGYQQHPDDVFITPETVRQHGLRDGLLIKCQAKKGARGPQLVELLSINGKDPAAYQGLPYFEELTAINPNKRLALETKPDRLTTRVIDMLAPIGRGQRGLIVAPPRTGKTTFLHHIAEAILENYEEQTHLIVMLIDERPEEVTDFQRSFPQADLFASSNDSDVKNHTRMSILAIERAKRLVEAGEHVFILLDSITRLARAFNNAISGAKNRGTQSGGLAVGALDIPRKLFAAARNTREGGSLTIIATALVQTNFKMDEAIFQEFKGTGNMELVLDRQLAQNYIYPAVDIHRSGTRREELLLANHMLEKIYVIRRGLAGYKPSEAMEWLIKCMGRYPSNAQMLMDIKTSAVA